MKRASLGILTIVGFSLGLFAFGSVKEGGIQGKVSPAEGVKAVIAVSGTDTLRSTISNGVFLFGKVKKGTYTVWVFANSPYKDTSIENVAVVDSATTDIGEINLIQ